CRTRAHAERSDARSVAGLPGRGVLGGHLRAMDDAGAPQPHVGRFVLVHRVRRVAPAAERQGADRATERAVAGGFVEKTMANGLPRRTEYRVTAHGRKLRPLLIELYRTGMALQAHGGVVDG